MLKSKVLVLLMAVVALATGCNKSEPGGHAGTKDSFQIVSTTPTATMKQGETKVVKMTVQRGDDFKQAVSLDSTQPEGLKVSLDKKKISGSDATEFNVTIEVDKAAALGEQTLRITGKPESGNPTSLEFKVNVEKGAK